MADTDTDPDPDAEPDRDADTDSNGSEDSASERTSETVPESAADPDGETAATHIDEAGELEPLGFSVVTIATDRTIETDTAGEAIVTALAKESHEVVTREHIGSDHDRVQSIVSRMIDRDDVDVVITGGATSVEPSDVTIEAVEPLLDKQLTAFDELFTRLAYEAVGTRAVAARTIAGVAAGTPVFCLPGDEEAARLGLEEIVLSEIRYLVALSREEIDEDRWATADPESASGGE